MVTQQILVLSFWVRIPAAQPEKGDPQRGSPFFDGLCCGNGGVFLLSSLPELPADSLPTLLSRPFCRRAFCRTLCRNTSFQLEPSSDPLLTLLSRPFCRRAFCRALCRSTSFLQEPPADSLPTLLSRPFCRRAFCRALCRSTSFLQEPPADSLPTLLSRPFCRRAFCRALCRSTPCLPELSADLLLTRSRQIPDRAVPSTVFVNLYR